MNKETIKEIGKLFLDLAKIIFAVAIVTPLVKDGEFQIIVVVLAMLSIAIGIYLTNKGA